MLSFPIDAGSELRLLHQLRSKQVKAVRPPIDSGSEVRRSHPLRSK